mmetsp:Transcript_21810/g.31281  ORF Transcript_21810/g.31281 Transcript_21810/m.31281 type:complete len:119 (+) Transcript_21810:71-427(+)
MPLGIAGDSAIWLWLLGQIHQPRPSRLLGPTSSTLSSGSHAYTTSNTRLLCTERGLLIFDLRLSAREQPRQNLYTDTVCKACALWNHPSYPNQTLMIILLATFSLEVHLVQLGFTNGR